MKAHAKAKSVFIYSFCFAKRWISHTPHHRQNHSVNFHCILLKFTPSVAFTTLKMMSDAPVSESVQVRLVEIFENERYSPLSGWSFKGLLPSDRNAFTTCDGRDGFTTMNEATEALVSLGKDQYCCFLSLPFLMEIFGSDPSTSSTQVGVG